MRLRSSAPAALLTLLLALAHSAHAQVVEISGGASTAYSAQGASLVLHGQQSEGFIGAGMVGGHFGIGGSSTRRIKGGTLSLGEQGFSLELPTDVFDEGHTFFGDGLGVQRAFSSHRSLTAFVGASSQDGGSPLFRSTNLGKLSSFWQWKQPLSSRCASWSTILLTSTQAVLESLRCSTSPHLVFGATLGVGAGAPYAAVSMILNKRRFDLHASFVDAGENFRRNNSSEQLVPELMRENIAGEWRPNRTVSVSWLHGNYFLPESSSAHGQDLPVLEGTSTLDEGSLFLHGHATGASLTLLHSAAKQPISLTNTGGSNVALSAAFFRSLGRFTWTETMLSSLEPHADQSYTLINGVAYDFNPHLRLTEKANVAATGTTFSPGGTLLTPFSTFSVDYQLVYIANSPGRPFRQALTGDMEMHLVRNLSLHASSTIGPTGTTLYTLQLNTLWAHASSASSSSTKVTLGTSILRGRVVDPAGNPIEGAALLIDAEPLYTDSNGFFFFREKRAGVHSFRVLPDEFLNMSNYVVISAPAQIRTATDDASAQLLRVVVARRPGLVAAQHSPASNEAARYP